MPVIPNSVEFDWQGSTGSHDRDSGINYRAVYRCRTDDPLDQAQIVVNFFRQNVVELATEYSYANDNTGSVSTSKNIRAQRLLATQDVWLVIITYNMEDDESKKNNEGEPTTDPLEYRTVLGMNAEQFTVPGRKLFLLQEFSEGLSQETVDMIGLLPTLPTPSSLVPYDPLPAIQKPRWALSVERNVSTFDLGDAYLNFLNSHEVNLNFQGLTLGGIKIWQMKIVDVQISHNTEQGIDFWKIRYYIDLATGEDNWLHLFDDISPFKRAVNGDPDGRGGVFGDGPEETPIIEGQPYSTPILDSPGGDRVNEPIPLDGDGKPGVIDPLVTRPEIPFGAWFEGNDVDFSQVPILSTVFESVPA